MKKIRIFICASSKDIDKAKIIRETLSDCYGFDAFLFDHSLIGSQDYIKEIVTHLDNCEIFIPLLSKNFHDSSFCNQEIGFAIYRQIKKQTIIYPISLDGTKSYDLFDHIQATPCDGKDPYGELKATTGFFNIIVSHRDFNQFQQRAIENMLIVLNETDNWKAISTIPYTLLEVIKNKITLTQKQLNKIVNAVKTNSAISEKPEQKNKLCIFLKDKYKITVD
jgi:hypothetical protein